jgi:hypothetical protein
VHSLAIGKNGVAVYRNIGAGRYVYVEVLPATRLAEYQLRITAARK